jgi:hypothetical protein
MPPKQRDSFDDVTERFSLRVVRAASWKQNYFGSHKDRLLRAIKELKEAIAEAEAHPELAP